MTDPFDYREPPCPLSGGENFYYPENNRNEPKENIPVLSIIAKLDELLNRENYEEANRLLLYWLNDARVMNDRRGELSILNELLGLSRRRNDREGGLLYVRESLFLIKDLSLDDQVNAATVKLNAATTCKCFGSPKEALPVYEEVLALYDKKLEKEDPLYAGLLNNMALTLTDLGRYEEAEKYFERAISIMQKKTGGLSDAAISFCNLAELYEKMYAGDNLSEIREKKIREAMDSAWSLLNDPSLLQNGYYAFVCRKCAPGFGYYGFFTRRKELDARADRIYEENRKQE